MTSSVTPENTNKFVFREISLGDLDGIVQIERAVNPFPWGEEALRDTIASSGHHLMSLREGRAVGFLLSSFVLDEAQLLLIGVSPDWQGVGVGGQLLKELINRSQDQGQKLIYLEVRSGNERAIRLYRSLGFIDIGVRRDYYPGLVGREDAIVMSLQIDQ
jgi:ribosomal-protein-alanine N-acetyltransferase